MIAEFYAIVTIIAMIVIGPILYLVVPRVLRQLSNEVHQEKLEQSQREAAEKEYEEWVKANGIPKSDHPVDLQKIEKQKEPEPHIEQKSGDVT